LAWIDARRPGLMRAYGGHAMAAGLSLPRDVLDPFREALVDGVEAALDGASLASETWTDGPVAGRDLGLPLAVELEQLGPWGQRFPEPLFEGQFEILEQRVVGAAHLKMVVRSRDGGEPLDAIAFNRLPEQLPSGALAGGGIGLLYRLSINRWRGSESCQLVVEDIIDQDH
jgi:single-stranded-DNA-specific exonuclease